MTWIFRYLNDIFGAEIAQVVEQWTENPRVGSSTLPLGTIFYAGVAQW